MRRLTIAIALAALAALILGATSAETKQRVPEIAMGDV